MKHLLEVMRVLAVLAALLLVAGCSTSSREAVETMMTGTYDTSVTIGRAQVRDAVRDGAVRPNGQPLFSRLETDYAFEGERFIINGAYLAGDGREQPITIILEFAVADGRLQTTIVEHTLLGMEAEIPQLEEGIANQLAADIAGPMSEEIVRFLDVSPEGSNLLTVRLRLAAARDDMVIPLDTQ